MKNEKVCFKTKAVIREMLFSSYVAGQLDKESLISRLGISARQFYRLSKKFRATNSLTHGLCGKSSNRSKDIELKDKVLLLYKDIYHGCNYKHFSELLFDDKGIEVSSDTLRKWLLGAKLTTPKRKKPKKYIRREPKPCFNNMLQLDGTFDDFLGNGTMQCLMHLVDDATKTSLAYLYDAECTQSALDILYKWCCKYGIPSAIYSDRHSTYKVNESQRLTIEEELEGQSIRLTEFGKVCEKLGIKQIFAYSPQAKGRVEKKHQMYKDRFIKELRLHGITTMDKANKYLILENGFIDKLNDKFTVEAKEASSVELRFTTTELAQHFTIDTTRIVRNDYTVSYNGQVLQLAKSSVVNARSRVQVKIYLDSSVKIFAGKYELTYHIIENYVKPIKEKKHKQATQVVTAKTSSPWRTYAPKNSHTSTNSTKHSSKNTVYYNYLARTFG